MLVVLGWSHRARGGSGRGSIKGWRTGYRGRSARAAHPGADEGATAAALSNARLRCFSSRVCSDSLRSVMSHEGETDDSGQPTIHAFDKNWGERSQLTLLKDSIMLLLYSISFL